MTQEGPAEASRSTRDAGPAGATPTPGTALRGVGLSVELRRQRLLDGVDFSVRGGEVVGILGANGAGKSSLLKALIGLLPLVQGQVLLDGTPLGGRPPEAWARQLAYLAQGHVAHWPLSVREVVAIGRMPHGRRPGAHDEAVVEQVLQATGLSALAARNVLTLSGGERARAMLARALAVSPRVLLADEPLAALDPAHQIRILELLAAEAQRGLAVALVLHDLPLAARYCTRLVLLHRGRVLANGPPDEVLDDARLARAFGIEAARFEHEGFRMPLPWRLTGRQGA